jgi:hypothetical protein
VQNTLTDGAVTETSTYGFDAAGRLVTASIPRHVLTYSYASTGGCGANAGAGKNGNRTGFSDTFDGGTPTTVAYCYDNADRLTSSTVTNAPAGAGPVGGGNLTTVGPGATLAYDTHGNTTRLGNQTLTYDVADRHTKTVLDDGTTITYVWGPGGDIISRTSSTGEVIRFGSGLVLNGSNQVTQTTLSLPGGASMSIVAAAGAVPAHTSWSYPNLHGDVILTTDNAGARVGARVS